MSDLNQCTFTGRLGADPEVRNTQNGKAVTSLRLAVGDTWRDKATGERKEKTEWVSVVIWNEALGKVASQYCKKGSRLLIQGAMQTRKWSDKDGNDRYSTEVVLNGFGDKLIMLDGKSENSAPKTDGTTRFLERGPATEELNDDLDQIPF